MARRYAGKRGPRLSKYSDEQLEAELERRRALRLRELKEAREKLDKEIASVASALGMPKAKAGRKPRAAKAVGAPVRKRTSQAELQSLAARIQKALAGQADGMGIAELRQAVRAKVPTLRLILRKMIADKQAKKKGDRRYTRYFSA